MPTCRCQCGTGYRVADTAIGKKAKCKKCGAVSGGIASLLVVGISLYFEIVAMRVIGLYYHHFKHRFAWDWG